MKKGHVARALICPLFLLIVSCSVHELETKNTLPSGDEVFFASLESYSEPDTKVYVDENVKILWDEDDRVTIFNKYTYNQEYRFAGETGDNAGAFKKVPNDDFVTGNSIDHIYAIYPFIETTKISNKEVMTITLPSEQFYRENSFGPGANVMTSATEDNNLLFKNVGGYLVLKFYGEGVAVSAIKLEGNNGELLSGKATVTHAVEGVPSVTMATDAGTSITLNCPTPVELGTTKDDATLFWLVVPPTKFTGGFTLTVTDANGNEFVKETTANLSIARNGVLRISPIEVLISELSATDLSAEGTANCYIVPSSGKYSFLAVKGNTLEPVGDVKGVKVLWETFGTEDVPEIGSIISPSVDYNLGTNSIIFETNENYTQGSALIAAFSDASCTDGNVLWSWHIWCTSDDLSSHLVNLRNNAGTIMDRNLGATSGTRSEYSCFSLLYQYGRKDPFLGGYHIDRQTIQQAASTGEWNTAALTGYDDAIKNPTTFFSSWAEGDDDAISWSVQKNMYDPCPPGYRIPDKYVYSAAAQYYSGESSMWSPGTRGTTIGWYNGNNYSDYQSVWFPNTNALYSASSLRSHRLYGSATRDGAVWTCGGSFYSAMYDGIVNTVSSWSLIPKKTGNAVRCVTESSPVVVNTESVSLSMNSITIDPNSYFDISASVYPSNANVDAINWNDLSSRFTMTTNGDGSVRFTDNTGTIGRYNIGAYSPLALYGSNEEWRIRWSGSLADICEVTVCPSEPTDYRYYGGWYLKAKAGDTISFSYFIGDDNDGNNDFSIYVGGQLVYEYPYHYSACSGDFSYTFEESFSGWVYLWWGWHSDIWDITTTATVLGRGEPYPSDADYALNDSWISQPSYKFEYNNHVLTMH